MRSITRWLVVLVCALVASPLTAKTVTVAVVRDGPSADDALVPLIQQQLENLLSDDSIEVRTDAAFDAGWQPERVRSVIEAAMRDRAVDYVVGLGMLVTQQAARTDFPLPKPFISAFDSRSDFPALPWSGDGSTKANLALLVIPQNAMTEVRALLQMRPLHSLHIAVEPAYLDAVENLGSGLDAAGREMGVTLTPVAIGDDVAAALAGLDSSVAAVYLTRLPRLNDAQRTTLLAGLNQRGIVTFSSEQSDVERGALAAMTPDVSDLVSRRVALNISRLERGETTAELPVVLTVESKLVLNGRTAAAIGFVPNYETRAFATILYPEAFDPDSRPLDVDGAVSQALETNVEIEIKAASVDASNRERQRSRGLMFPQVNLDADANTGERLVVDGFFPSELGVGGLSVSQMIYDNVVVSEYRSSGHFYRADLADQLRQRLDVINDAAQAFLRFSQARVAWRIQQDNVQLTQDNLELSRIRYEVGYSGQDEVFRWEAELGERRAQLLQSDADVETARITLNQILGIDQGQRWQTDEMHVDASTYELGGMRVADLAANQRLNEDVRGAILQIAYENAPELMTLDHAREGQGIRAGAAKRRYFIPTLQADFRYDYFWRYDPELAGRRDDTWRVSLVATYPLFLGNNKYYDMKREQAVQRSIDRQRELARQQIERRVRTAQRRIEASFPSIDLLQHAAENARRNLDVVQEKYAQGILNVTDLLSAQNQAFQADQRAAAAVYRFLIDIEELQRSFAWYFRDHTSEENAELVQRIRQAYGLE